MYNNRVRKAGVVIDRHINSKTPTTCTPDQKEFYDKLKSGVRKHLRYLHEVEGMPAAKLPGWYLAFKRGMDISVGVTGLILLSPLFLVVAAMIKIDSRGPVIFSQERVGKDGKPFNIHKFRTMIDNAEENTGAVWTIENDPRLTFIGRYLRKSKIDEFPQFVNLVKGEMTLVGPRPERPELVWLSPESPEFAEAFADIIPGYLRRLDVTPGITGTAQLRNGYDRNPMDVIRKLRYDITYTKKMGLSMDLGLLWETFWRMLTGKF